MRTFSIFGLLAVVAIFEATINRQGYASPLQPEEISFLLRYSVWNLIAFAKALQPLSMPPSTTTYMSGYVGGVLRKVVVHPGTLHNISTIRQVVRDEINMDHDDINYQVTFKVDRATYITNVSSWPLLSDVYETQEFEIVVNETQFTLQITVNKNSTRGFLEYFLLDRALYGGFRRLHPSTTTRMEFEDNVMNRFLNEFVQERFLIHENMVDTFKVILDIEYFASGKKGHGIPPLPP
ncbi:uncharacterized protein LOC135397778 [Ornithodoros turicata]|uniref:uncharacterized protein LOC135397778 n=1 Tax=Ornithodoros turicata TaxID=34597 RepID=UPI003138F2BE